MKKIDKSYISSIDKKLAEFDQAQPLSTAQQAEVNKYSRIYQLRDDPASVQPERDDLWD